MSADTDRQRLEELKARVLTESGGLARVTALMIAGVAERAIRRADEAERALRHIAGLETRADDCRGMVDDPHTKALRAASKIARESLKAMEEPSVLSGPSTPEEGEVPE